MNTLSNEEKYGKAENALQAFRSCAACSCCFAFRRAGKGLAIVFRVASGGHPGGRYASRVALAWVTRFGSNSTAETAANAAEK
jgi:hypothetical protein